MTLEEYKQMICLKADALERSGRLSEYNGLMYAVDRLADLSPLPEAHGCYTCLAQGCRYRTTRIERLNCPLWKESAV